MQGLGKTREGSSYPDRDAQFQYINQKCREFQQRGQPVISDDSKKKELVGISRTLAGNGTPRANPNRFALHDFADKRKGKVTPHGVYDIGRNQGWVSVGIDHDTAAFAVDSIHHWWLRMGQPVYPEAKELLI